MTFYFENSSTYIELLLVLIFLLYQIGCDKTKDELLTEEISNCASYGKVCKNLWIVKT